MAAEKQWKEYVEWLKKHAPAAHKNLARPASAKEIAEVERVTGYLLPAGVKAVWSLNNGQKKTLHVSSPLAHAMPCLPSLSFLSTKLVIRFWREWADLRNNKVALGNLQECGESLEPGVVQALYTHAGWIPLWGDPGRADFIGVDLAPDKKGKLGQVINFGRDEERHFSPASSFEDLLTILLEEVRSGKWPVSEDEDGKPWFGPPEAHFFNALHARWKRRKGKQPPAGKDANAVLLEAWVATDRGEHARALKLVKKARALGVEKHAEAHWHEGRALEGLRRYAEAEVAYGLATGMGETGSVYVQKRANNLLNNLRRPAEAEAFLRRTLSLLSKEQKGRAVFAPVFHLMGQAVGYYQHRFEESLPHLKHACELNEHNPEHFGSYAHSLAALGQADKALKQAKRAFEDSDDEKLALQALFYLYAMSKPAPQKLYLKELRELLAEKHRSPAWDFGPVVAAAAKLKHGEREWLAKLADVVTGAAKPAVLKGWAAWKEE